MTTNAPSQPNPILTLPGFRTDADTDRLGVIASTLCAVHCAATPVLLLLLPTFGAFWAHPASHWGMAAFVVPIAILMMTRGYQRHRRRSIIALGTLGILLVIAGAIAPHVEQALSSGSGPEAVSMAGAGAHACADTCCPSIHVHEDGNRSLRIPAASILTTAGGLFLIITHLGNLRRCSSCGRKE